MHGDLLNAWPRLADELRQLREAADLTTRQLAERLDWSQSKVTRLERARTVPTIGDVRAWAAATVAPTDQAARLLELVERVHTEAIMVRAARRAGLPELQRQAAESERTAMALRIWSPTSVPGLLQTPDYARQVFFSIDPDRLGVSEWVAERMRRQTILYEQHRRFEFVIGEAALRWRYGPAGVQLGQLDRIRTLAVLANVTVAVLPLERETPVWRSHGFTVFADRLDDADPFVHVELLTATLNVTEPGDVKTYQQVLDRLRQLAVDGEQVQALLASIMDELQRRAV